MNLIKIISSENGDYKTHESYHNDEVRTLFVSGLPSDVKQRELRLLFRPYKGTGKTPICDL
jgi:RNA recognition motif-containing protein